jgi:hypothetical protein
MEKSYFRKDYFGSVNGDKIIISSNPNSILVSYEDLNDLTKRYLYKEGDKIVTPFGIQTIKDIDRQHSDKHGYEWLITVEENGNQYNPCELIGIYVKTIDI